MLKFREIKKLGFWNYEFGHFFKILLLPGVLKCLLRIICLNQSLFSSIQSWFREFIVLQTWSTVKPAANNSKSRNGMVRGLLKRLGWKLVELVWKSMIVHICNKEGQTYSSQCDEIMLFLKLSAFRAFQGINQNPWGIYSEQYNLIQQKKSLYISISKLEWEQGRVE